MVSLYVILTRVTWSARGASLRVPDRPRRLRMAESIEKGFKSWLRKSSRQRISVRCPVCGTEVQNATDTSFAKHIRTAHPELISKEKGEGSSTTVSDLWTQAKEEIAKRTTPSSCVPYLLIISPYLLAPPAPTHKPIPTPTLPIMLSPSAQETYYITCKVYSWT